MKKATIILLFLLMATLGKTQLSNATLQATGLTCALCSNAINKALLKLSFVDSVKADIKNSSFNIIFKKEAEVNIDDIKLAVEDAGFSVGTLKITGYFTNLKIENDLHVRLGNANYLFINGGGQILNGDRTFTVVDKNFIAEKQFKKWVATTKMACIKTGKAIAGCCTKEGIAEGSRIYHVII